MTCPEGYVGDLRTLLRQVVSRNSSRGEAGKRGSDMVAQSTSVGPIFAPNLAVDGDKDLV